MDTLGRDARLALVAGRQGGAFTFRQAIEAGYSKATVARRVRAGAWVRLHSGVYTFGGAPPTRTLDLWAAVLGSGRDSVVSHESAALLHGAEGLSVEPITLTAVHGHHQALAGVFVHQISDLAARHRTEIARLPVSSPARTVVELGATQPVTVIGRVADDLVRSGRTSYGSIERVLAELNRPGKPGIARVAEVLAERGDGYVPPASELERLLFETLEAGGLPAPVRQLRLPGRGPLRGIADGGYLDAQIVLEADGRRWHLRVEAARRDRERDAQAARAGFVTLRFLHEQLRDDPASVCDTVSETREVRLRQLGRVA
jgi:hypothetical protein